MPTRRRLCKLQPGPHAKRCQPTSQTPLQTAARSARQEMPTHLTGASANCSPGRTPRDANPPHRRLCKLQPGPHAKRCQPTSQAPLQTAARAARQEMPTHLTDASANCSQVRTPRDANPPHRLHRKLQSCPHATASPTTTEYRGSIPLGQNTNHRKRTKAKKKKNTPFDITQKGFRHALVCPDLQQCMTSMTQTHFGDVPPSST